MSSLQKSFEIVNKIMKNEKNLKIVINIKNCKFWEGFKILHVFYSLDMVFSNNH